jgi:hypothetical protein
LVNIDETPIAAILRYLRELTGFRLAKNFPMFQINVIDGYKDHETIKIRLFVTDVLWDHCKYRNSFQALTMANKLIADKAALDEHLIAGVGHGAINPEAFPTTVECPNIDDLIIPVYEWDGRDDKSHCIDFGEMYTAYQIKSNLGADAGIIPLFHDKHAMRDFNDENGIWAAVLVALKTKMPAKEMDMNRHLNADGSKDMVNMSRFLQKIEHCNGEDSVKLNNHLKQSRLKIQGFGINPDSNQAVVILVSSFTGKLGNWASDHTAEIYALQTLDELISYVRVGFSIEDVEGKNLYSLIQVKQNDKSLTDYTQEFNNAYSYWKNSIDVKAAVYIYIGGLKNGALRADLMTNWQMGKYVSLISLQNDAAKNSLWRASSSLPSGSSTPSNSNNDRQPKQQTKQWPKSPKNDSKHWSKTSKWSPKGNASVEWSKGKSADANKRKVVFEKDKSFESWNKAKGKLTDVEYNKRRRTNACINCGEVGHKFSECPKPKP